MLTSIAKNVNKILIITLLFFLFGAKCNAKIPNPTSDFYVNDYADVLTEETEEYIIAKNKELEKKTGAQIVIVTVRSLDDRTIEEYANELFRKYEIGDKEKNNGILLLCSTGDRMFRIEVGYGLEGCLPDGKTGRIQDEYIIPYLKENNYDDGIRNGFTACLKVIANEYQISISTEEIQPITYSDNTGEMMAIITGIICIFIVISIIIHISGGRGGGTTRYGGYSSRGSFRVRRIPVVAEAFRQEEEVSLQEEEAHQEDGGSSRRF